MIDSEAGQDKGAVRSICGTKDRYAEMLASLEMVRGR